MESIKQSYPAYQVLKKLSARPGDWDEGSFDLPCHENMSNAEKAKSICEHFSKISQEFPPLHEDLLPPKSSEEYRKP